MVGEEVLEKSVYEYRRENFINDYGTFILNLSTD